MNYLVIGLIILVILICAFSARGKTHSPVPVHSSSNSTPLLRVEPEYCEYLET